MKLTSDQLADRLRKFDTRIETGVLVVKMGPEDATQRVFLDVGTHGQEIAAPLALLEFAEKYAEDWSWPNVQALGVVTDADAYNEIGYGFVGVDGSRSCWPPLWGYRQDNQRYWTFVDNNSAWGNLAELHLPPFHRALRKTLCEYKPTFLLSMHETVENETRRAPFWCGSGLLVIEAYPLSAEMYEAIIGIPNPARNPLGFFGYLGRRWLTFVTGLPRWKRNAKILSENSDWGLITRIVKRYKERSGLLMGNKWMRYLELFGELSVGEARILGGPDRMRSDWMTIMDFATRTFGIPSVTTETFPVGEIGLVGIDWRVGQNLDFICATMDVLNEKA